MRSHHTLTSQPVRMLCVSGRIPSSSTHRESAALLGTGRALQFGSAWKLPSHMSTLVADEEGISVCAWASEKCRESSCHSVWAGSDATSHARGLHVRMTSSWLKLLRSGGGGVSERWLYECGDLISDVAPNHKIWAQLHAYVTSAQGRGGGRGIEKSGVSSEFS